MGFDTNSIFMGEYNGTNPQKLLKQIDYKKDKLDERKEVVQGILDTGFYDEYFSDYFKVNINSGDSLSETDVACSSLEKMANYLLMSAEVKEEKDTEYIYYTDEESFRKAVYREGYIENIAGGADKENVMHFLKQEQRNEKKAKEQKIVRADIFADNELGKVLRDYDTYLKSVTQEIKDGHPGILSRYKLSEISGSVKNDMIYTKDALTGVFGYKTNAEESCVYDWSQIDMTNPTHVTALLYMKPGNRADLDLQYTIDEFVELLKLAAPTKLQKDIILGMRDNKRIIDISRELEISRQRCTKNIQMLVSRIIKVAKKLGNE